MKNINYFKLYAKNLFRDYKSEYNQSDTTYDYNPQFFDINKIVIDFDLDTDKPFSLMNAQHLIAKIVGLKSWSELINSNDEELNTLKDILDNLEYKIIRKKTYSIDFSKWEKISKAGHMGDYLVRCKKTPELLEIIQMKPDSLFMSVPTNEALCAMIDIDTEHLYVNIIPQFNMIRVHIPNTDWHNLHAVSVKNIGK